jgi:hypothetical protein
MLVVLVGLTSGVCLAATETLNMLMVVNPDVGLRTDSKTRDLMTAQNWTLACVAENQLYATTGNATLAGNFGGKIWKFECSVNGTNWQDVATLVSGASTKDTDIGGPAVIIPSQYTLPKVFYARYLRISYDATLTADPTTATVAAGGFGTFEATAVPEPSSAVALATGVVGIIGLLRRRKS